MIFSVTDIGHCFVQPGVSDWILLFKPQQKAFNDWLFMGDPGLLDGIERFIFLMDLVLFVKKLVIMVS